MIVKSRSLKSFIVTLLFVVTTLAQADILTQYRLHGIDGIVQEMDAQLAGKEYWSSYLSDKNTTFGYIESYKNILVCDIANAQLSLYVKKRDKDYSFISNYNAFTGKNGGDKVKEGDLKTPVGIYTLTHKLSQVDSYYGPMAFVTSYPNIYDRYKGKNGHGIWLHGMPLHQQRDKFTKGCIAINNECLLSLDKDIDITKTVLIIHDKITNKKVSKDRLAGLLSQLYAWRYAWIYNDIKTYLNFYDPKFIRADGESRDQFASYKERLFKREEHKKIIFNHLNVIPYPGTDAMYEITFHEIYQSDSFSFRGEKILIVKLENAQMKIITEQ